MKIESIDLYTSPRHLAGFLGWIALILVSTLAREYLSYSHLVRFDDAFLEAVVLKQYPKDDGARRYTVMKLMSADGASFYMRGSPRLQALSGRTVSVRIFTKSLSFTGYLRGFYAPGYIVFVERDRLWRYRAADMIAKQHADAGIGAMFGALFMATPIPLDIRSSLAALGISHLLAISGFHVGLLTLLLLGVLRVPYRRLQSRYFPWRHGKRDLFLICAVILLGYVLVLGMPPSVLRAFAMLLIGYYLYDRGIKVVSGQTLFVAVAILIALWPRLLFSVGFWLSVAGVMSIVLFLQTADTRKRVSVFIQLHVWVYLMMLPPGLLLFGIFSGVHPLSIFWTMGFMLFYPLALLLHLLGAGNLLDPLSAAILALGSPAQQWQFASGWLIPWGVLSLFAFKSQAVKGLMLLLAFGIFIGAVYEVA